MLPLFDKSASLGTIDKSGGRFVIEVLCESIIMNNYSRKTEQKHKRNPKMGPRLMQPIYTILIYALNCLIA